MMIKWFSNDDLMFKTDQFTIPDEERGMVAVFPMVVRQADNLLLSVLVSGHNNDDNNDDDDDDGRQSISMMLSLAYNHFLSSYHQRNVCPRGKGVVLKTRTSNMKTQINTAINLCRYLKKNTKRNIDHLML